jgi:mannosyl-oligosaccharide alpha-1,2-mannosidase
MLGGLAPQYRSMYEKFIEAAKKHLFFRPLTPDNRHVLISGTTKVLDDYTLALDSEGQHLTCFTGGMVGIASKIFNRPQDMETAKRLVEGCIWAYQSTPTGIMPELFKTVPCLDPKSCVWDRNAWYGGITRHQASQDSSLPKKTLKERAEELIEALHLPEGFTLVHDTRYNLRPEAIESLFIMYRLTGDTKYQDIAWTMFASIDRVTKSGISYAGIHTVLEENPPKIDSSESFWMAETLKYFFLIFSEPDVISLDEFVLYVVCVPQRDRIRANKL